MHGGWCLKKDLEACTCNVCSRTGGWSILKAASILLVVQGARDRSRGMKYYCWALPRTASDKS